LCRGGAARRWRLPPPSLRSRFSSAYARCWVSSVCCDAGFCPWCSWASPCSWAVVAALGSRGATTGRFRTRVPRTSPTRTPPAAGRHQHRVGVSRGARLATLVVVCIVAANWLERVVAVYRRGLTDGDSMMYHLVFAARYVQSGSTTATDPVGPDAWLAFYPANVELMQAASILPFGTDVVIPLMNLGWLALALLASWCIGAEVGLTQPPRNCEELAVALGVSRYEVVVVQRSLFTFSHPGVDPVPTWHIDCLRRSGRAELVMENRAGAVFTLGRTAPIRAESARGPAPLTRTSRAASSLPDQTTYFSRRHGGQRPSPSSAAG
jgi:hypothetical protein